MHYPLNAKKYVILLKSKISELLIPQLEEKIELNMVITKFSYSSSFTWVMVWKECWNNYSSKKFYMLFGSLSQSNSHKQETKGLSAVLLSSVSIFAIGMQKFLTLPSLAILQQIICSLIKLLFQRHWQFTWLMITSLNLNWKLYKNPTTFETIMVPLKVHTQNFKQMSYCGLRSN